MADKPIRPFRNCRFPALKNNADNLHCRPLTQPARLLKKRKATALGFFANGGFLNGFNTFNSFDRDDRFFFNQGFNRGFFANGGFFDGFNNFNSFDNFAFFGFSIPLYDTRRTGMGAGAGMAGNGLTPAMIMRLQLWLLNRRSTRACWHSFQCDGCGGEVDHAFCDPSV